MIDLNAVKYDYLDKQITVDYFCTFLPVQVLATAADPNLGGRNFDEVLVDHFVEDFKVRLTWQ